jgi:hypothetical protein
VDSQRSYMNDNPARSFEALVSQILAANGFVIEAAQAGGPNRRYDFAATMGGLRWIVEVKYYRTGQAQISLIEHAAAQLISLALNERAKKGMLVVSSFIPPDARASLEQRYKLLVVDRVDLLNWCATVPELLDQLQGLLEDGTSTETGGRSLIDAKSAPSLSGQAPVVPQVGQSLCDELIGLKSGRANWAAYEKLCDRILHYLFPNDLHGWHKQKRTEDGFNRFDYVCRIKSRSSFWRFLIQNLGSRYVLFEFKNYSTLIKQGQILTTEKYLLERGLRRAAIVLTRVGADKGAGAMTQGAMREHGKLVLVLDDKKVCQMLQMKDQGDDPADLLFDTADEFLLSLPR